MSLETDLLLDRRRLKRRLVFWRTFAVLAVAAVAVVALRGKLPLTGTHLARLPVNGLITEDRRLTEAVARLAEDPAVPALIVSIDSPGGSVGGGESLYDAIALVAARKPVVAVMRGTAASAGYMVALPATRIFARGTTLTGSIGVLLQTGEVSGLLDRIGISTQTIVSGPLKDQPSFTRPLSPEGRAVLQGLVTDMYEQFVAMVATGRHMDPARVRQLADGRAYSGHQALPLGLIDEIGDERAARAWLAANKEVSASLPIEDVSTTGYAGRALAGAVSSIVNGVWKGLVSQSLKLDGAWSVWQFPAK